MLAVVAQWYTMRSDANNASNANAKEAFPLDLFTAPRCKIEVAARRGADSGDGLPWLQSIQVQEWQVHMLWSNLEP